MAKHHDRHDRPATTNGHPNDVRDRDRHRPEPGGNGLAHRLVCYNDDTPGPSQPEDYSHPIIEIYGPSELGK